MAFQYILDTAVPDILHNLGKNDVTSHISDTVSLSGVSEVNRNTGGCKIRTSHEQLRMPVGPERSSSLVALKMINSKANPMRYDQPSELIL